jgi:RNA polymerase sigma-70 factor (TIGR02960 family)
VTAELIARCRAGDAGAFGELVEPFRRELMVHCYRFLGSMHDAEDALQETLLDAWRGLGAFEGRSSVRTWLYRVATNRCLKILRSAGRRPRMAIPGAGSARFELPEPSAHGEVVWLEPYPDVLLEGLGDPAPGPEACYDAKQAISLAFVTAVQLLPPRQRAVLILRDVLGWSAAETAALLDTSVASVTSALQRARATLKDNRPEEPAAWTPPSEPSAEERALLQRYMDAHARADAPALVAMMREDIRFTMPPQPTLYAGRASVGEFLAEALRTAGDFRLVPTTANRMPAAANYLRAPGDTQFRALSLDVLRFVGGRLAEITTFEPSLFTYFGLPETWSV